MAIALGPVRKVRPPKGPLPYREMRGYSHYERILIRGPGSPGYDEACRELNKLQECIDIPMESYISTIDIPSESPVSYVVDCQREPIVQKMEALRSNELVANGLIVPPIKYFVGGAYNYNNIDPTNKLEVGWFTASNAPAWISIRMKCCPKKIRQHCEKYYDFIGVYVNKVRWWNRIFRDIWGIWDAVIYFDYQESALAVADLIALDTGWQRQPNQFKSFFVDRIYE